MDYEESVVIEKPLLHLTEHKLQQDQNDYGMSDETWDLAKFKNKFRIVIVRYLTTKLNR